MLWHPKAKLDESNPAAITRPPAATDAGIVQTKNFREIINECNKHNEYE